MIKPLVSIITPSYNSQVYLTETINSVLKQTYTNWELIIVDDCSTDNSYIIYDSFIKLDERIKVFKNIENLGPAKSRNVAIEQSLGEYIAFLDSDDWWHPEKLESQLEFMQNNKIVFSYSSCVIFREKNNKEYTYHAPKKITIRSIKYSNFLFSPSVMYKQGANKFYVPLVENAVEDWAHWISIIDHYKVGYLFKKPISYYRQRDDSISAKKFTMVKKVWRLFNKTYKYSFFKSGYHFFLYAFFNIKKHLLLLIKLK